jgi:hypothetical protein
MTHEPATTQQWMQRNEADNIKRAAEIREAYKRQSRDALELAEWAAV